MAETATFLLAGDGAVDVRGAEGTSVRLAPGEATFRPAGSSAAVQAGDPAQVGVITIAPAATGQAGAFTPGAGPHDVDLLRDVLAPGESLALPAGLPAFVVVTSGAVNDDDTTLEAGAAALVAGGQSLSNSIDHGAATVVVAVIGPTFTIGPPSSTSTSSPEPCDDRSHAAPTPPVTTVPPTPPPTTVPPTAPPTCPTTVSPDSDDDGLTDAEEADLGTDPNDSTATTTASTTVVSTSTSAPTRPTPIPMATGGPTVARCPAPTSRPIPPIPTPTTTGSATARRRATGRPTRTTPIPTRWPQRRRGGAHVLHAPAQTGHRRRLLR